ncbi:hypothetical protein IQ07DRAFT_597035 [Pyrenochaeta sp. DS3sAY3a]|nr:hypothetical protein IQ07DRAFT_597035 [Pyrenochaeta sp. DS3sAY3a]
MAESILSVITQQLDLPRCSRGHPGRDERKCAAEQNAMLGPGDDARRMRDTRAGAWRRGSEKSRSSRLGSWPWGGPALGLQMFQSHVWQRTAVSSRIRRRQSKAWASEEFRPGSQWSPLEGLRNCTRSRRSELEGVHWGEKKALAALLLNLELPPLDHGAPWAFLRAASCRATPPGLLRTTAANMILSARAAAKSPDTADATQRRESRPPVLCPGLFLHINRGSRLAACYPSVADHIPPTHLLPLPKFVLVQYRRQVAMSVAGGTQRIQWCSKQGASTSSIVLGSPSANL